RSRQEAICSAGLQACPRGLGAPHVATTPMRDSVIVSAVRTPTGKFLGALKELTAPQLGALVVAEAVRRAGIEPAVVDECGMGNGEVVDSMIAGGLWCAFEQCHMGNAGEVVADEYHIDRAAQDEYAASSHQRAARATDAGAFKDEILPIVLPQKKGPPVTV